MSFSMAEPEDDDQPSWLTALSGPGVPSGSPAQPDGPARNYLRYFGERAGAGAMASSESMLKTALSLRAFFTLS